MERMSSYRLNSRFLLIPAMLFLLGGCVYFNTFYLARKKFNEAERMQKEKAKSEQDKDFGQSRDNRGGSPGDRNRNVPRGGTAGRSQLPGGRIEMKAGPQERNLYEDAIKKASKVLTYHPKSKWADDALWLIGKSYFSMGDYGASDRKFKELVTNHPKSEFVDDAYYYMGLCQIELDDEDLALEAFANVEREFPKSGYVDDVYFIKGKLARKDGELQKAIEQFDRYLDRFPGGDSAALAMFSTGQCYEELGDFPNAFKRYRSVKKYGPSRRLEFEAALSSGSAVLQTDSVALGMKILSDLAGDERYFSELARIRLKIADGFLREDSTDKSIEEYKAIAQDNPKTPESAEAFYRLGLIYQNYLFDITKAKDAFAKVQSEYPQSDYRNLALAKSAQIAKFETYQIQLLKADSVRTVTTSEKQEVPIVVDDQDNAIVDTVIIAEDSLLDEIPANEGVEPEFEGPLPEEPDSSKQMIKGRSFADAGSVRVNPDSVYASDSTYYTVEPENAVVGKAGGSPEKTSADSIMAAAERKAAREDSIRQAILESAIETRFLLAELYSYELSQPDSAINEYLLIVAQYPDSPYAPKSLLAAAGLRFGAGDSASAEGYLQSLVANYPESPQATVAAEILGCPLDLSKNALGLYVYAESLAFEGNNPDSAAVIFGQIAQNYPDLAPKASFARAWAIDLATNGEDSSAYYAYESVSRDFPRTIYADAANERLGIGQPAQSRRPSRNEQPQQQGKESKPDTSRQFSGGLPLAPPVKTLGEFVYPRSLLDRRLKGEVLFKIKINLFGKVDEYDVIGPSGEHAIDSSAIAALLETEFDTSGLDLAQLDTYFRYSIPFERPDINIYNDPYREENRDRP